MTSRAITPERKGAERGLCSELFPVNDRDELLLQVDIFPAYGKEFAVV